MPQFTLFFFRITVYIRSIKPIGANFDILFRNLKFRKGTCILIPLTINRWNPFSNQEIIMCRCAIGFLIRWSLKERIQSMCFVEDRKKASQVQITRYFPRWILHLALVVDKMNPGCGWFLVKSIDLLIRFSKMIEDIHIWFPGKVLTDNCSG